MDCIENQGFAVVSPLVTESQLEPLQGVLERVVQRRAEQLYREGLIQDVCVEADFDVRWHRIIQQCVADEESSIWNQWVFSREIYDLLVQPAILDVIENLIGPEIRANGDYWVRPMAPMDRVTPVPWHQDSAYYPDHPSGPRDILTVWIPLVDVDSHNGCLEVIPGSHNWGLIDTRLSEGGKWKEPVLDPLEKGTLQPVPMRRGDALVFSNLLFHRSSLNRSNSMRWSVDLRYSPTALQQPQLYQTYPGFIARSKCRADSVETFAVWRDRVTAG